MCEGKIETCHGGGESIGGEDDGLIIFPAGWMDGLMDGWLDLDVKWWSFRAGLRLLCRVNMDWQNSS